MGWHMKILICLIGLLWLMLSAPAWAILGLGDIVSDPPTETNTAAAVEALATANTALGAIQTSDAMTATSVTTSGGAGLFQGVSPFLDSLDSNFANGVTAASFPSIFPGWQPLPPDVIPAASTIAAATLATYEAAMQAAQGQARDFDTEDAHFSQLEGDNAQVASVLAALQANTEAQLATAQQVQMERQLLVALITVEAAKAGEEINERAQGQATTAQAANLGVSPQ